MSSRHLASKLDPGNEAGGFMTQVVITCKSKVQAFVARLCFIRPAREFYCFDACHVIHFRPNKLFSFLIVVLGKRKGRQSAGCLVINLAFLAVYCCGSGVELYKRIN